MVKQKIIKPALPYHFPKGIDLRVVCSKRYTRENKDGGVCMIQIISAGELKARLDEEDVRVLDVREDDEFVLGHIRGAMNLPLSGFPEIMSRLDWHLKYYVIDASGDRSDRACKYLD